MAFFAYNLPTDNKAGNATWAAEASADASYPATNIPLMTDLNRGNPGKLTIATDGGWTADFGSAQRIDVIAVWTNADAGISIQLQGNATNSWGSPTLTTTLTAPAKREDGFTVKLFKDLTGVAGYSASGFRWWRIHFVGTNSQNWGLKAWMGSTLRTMDRTLQAQQHNVEHHQFIRLTTDFGYDWVYDLQSAPRSLTGIITLKHSTSWVNLLSWYRSAGGPSNPILFIPDPAVNDAWICRFGADLPDSVARDALDVTQITPNISPVTVSFEELSGGGPEWT